MMRARIAQREEKVRSVQEEKESERASAERFRREYEVQLEVERARHEARREAAVAHKRDLIVQIQSNEEEKRRDKAREVRDAEEARKREARERDALERIRLRKIKEMERDAVPEKYTVELRSKQSACAR